MAGGADEARTRLVDELRASGRLTSRPVEAAFRAVPRHVFLPQIVPASQAYQDEAVVIKTDEGGLPVSSSSQPAIMAIMLEQLGVAEGQRVLEIGTGTGYNAALMTRLVGPAGSVVTVDIDPDLANRARANLVAAGYPDVIVICGDGGFGAPEFAPYDRIIVTAGASDLAPAWLAQLGPGGRIALPLSLRGLQLCIALERSGSGGGLGWRSLAACRCGFIRMAGSYAEPTEPYVPVGPQPGLHVQTDGQPVDPGLLWGALNGPVTDVPTGVRVAGLGELGEADLWVTIMEPDLARLTITGGGPLRGPVLPLLPFGALATAGASGDLATTEGSAGLATTEGSAGLATTEGSAGLATTEGSAGLATTETSGGLGVAGLLPASAWASAWASPSPLASARERQSGEFEIAVRGFGPGAAPLAERLAGRVAAWQSAGRPRVADLVVTAYPRTPSQPAPSEAARSEAARSEAARSEAARSEAARSEAAAEVPQAATAAEPLAAGAQRETRPVASPASSTSEVPAVPARPGQTIVDRPHTRLVLTWSAPPLPDTSAGLPRRP
jgi:protein-L-isoaspartate(D-aspartate) O-methyltransferase